MSNSIFAILILISSCCLTAISRIVLKKAMSNSNSLTAMVSSLFFGWWGLFFILIFSTSSFEYTIPGILFFAGIGLVAPPIVRYLTYIGVERLGPSRSDSIRSLTPVFAVVFSFLFFNEEFKPMALISVFVILIGVRLITKKNNLSTTSFNKYDFLYPFIAAVLAGLISNARKLGMDLNTSPIISAFSAATSANLIFIIFLIHKKRYKKISYNKESLKYLVATGVIVSITDVIDLVALKRFSVALVAPILASTPLFIILFSYFFLDEEEINLHLILGTLLIVLGSVLLLYLYT